jgi:hypothetical protein
MSHLLLLLTDYDHGGSLASFCWFYLLFHSGVIYRFVGCIPPLKADGILHQDSKEKANILNKQFQMAFLTKTELSDESFKQPAT